jgi:hypothetical protein
MTTCVLSRWVLSVLGFTGRREDGKIDRVTASRLAVFLCILSPIACDGQPALSGAGEPIQVVNGQFIAGDLPAGAAGPAITATQFNNQLVIPGVAGKSISGRASDTASAVGVRFADLGSGYWVVPVAEPDSMFPGEVAFRFSANFDANDAPGFHSLRFVAIDASGRAGAPSSAPVCIANRIPDNLHSCEPNIAPPNAVISLQWDTNFDVDLHVLTPSGADISPKSPLGAPLEAGVAPAPNAPRIDRDSLGGCVPDGLRQEDLVFQDPPPPGSYQIRADPFAACGQSAVRFKLTLYQVAGKCPNCALQAMSTQAGELLASQVTAGASAGLFVAQYSF